MINNKEGPLSFSPLKVNVLFPLQHYMVTWRWVRLTIISESGRYQYDHLGASCNIYIVKNIYILRAGGSSIVRPKLSYVPRPTGLFLRLT